MKRQVIMLMSGQAHLPYLAVCLHTLRNHWDGSIRVFAWPESIDIVREIAKDERLGIECELRDPAYRARRDERIRPMSVGTLFGLGEGCGLAWSHLATLCSPSDSGRVVLGLTTNGIDCFCSPNWYTPTATDWKGGTEKDRRDGGNRSAFRHQYRRRTGYRYPDPAVTEAVMGFPAGWTDLDVSATP